MSILPGLSALACSCGLYLHVEHADDGAPLLLASPRGQDALFGVMAKHGFVLVWLDEADVQRSVSPFARLHKGQNVDAAILDVMGKLLLAHFLDRARRALLPVAVTS